MSPVAVEIVSSVAVGKMSSVAVSTKSSVAVSGSSPVLKSLGHVKPVKSVGNGSSVTSVGRRVSDATAGSEGLAPEGSDSPMGQAEAATQLKSGAERQQISPLEQHSAPHGVPWQPTVGPEEPGSLGSSLHGSPYWRAASLSLAMRARGLASERVEMARSMGRIVEESILWNLNARL